MKELDRLIEKEFSNIIRCCARCGRVYIHPNDCPNNCNFGSYSAFYVFGPGNTINIFGKKITKTTKMERQP